MLSETSVSSESSSSTHQFLLHSYFKLAYCGVCSKALWGISKQGLKCQVCGLDVHESCQQSAPECLGLDTIVCSFSETDDDLDEVEIEFKLVRGNNLAKKYPLHTPDPFAEIIINDECYWTTIQKRTFNPTWNFEINLTVKLNSHIKIFVYDNKRFKPKQHGGGFLGLCIIHIRRLLLRDLVAGVTEELRLLKVKSSDTVTGRVTVLIRLVNPSRDEPTLAAYLQQLYSSEALEISRKEAFEKFSTNSDMLDIIDVLKESHISETGDEKMNTPNYYLRKLSGGINALQPATRIPTTNLKKNADSLTNELLPSAPKGLKCEVKSETSILITWDPCFISGEDTSKSSISESQGDTSLNINQSNLLYVLERAQGFSSNDETDFNNHSKFEIVEEYYGPHHEHLAVALKPDVCYKFRVKAENIYGSGKFSDWSDTVIPEAVAPEPPEDDHNTPIKDSRPHCPFYMAGYCHSGKKCKFSHGTGVMDENDIAVAMLAARINRNPQAELALAIAASLLEKSSHEVNKVHLSQQKRTFHEKVCLLRSTLRMSKGEVHLTVDRNALFATSFLEIMYRPKKELKKKLFVHFKGEGGLDYGGLAREWFYLLSHELFTPKRGLFEFSDHQSYLLQIANNFSVDIYMKEAEDLECLLNEKNNNNNNNTANNNNNNSNNNDDDNKLNKSPSQELSPSNRLDASLSVTNEDVSNEPHLSLAELRSKMDSRYYLFLGRVLGLAVFHNHFVDAVFVNTFYRCLGGFPITLRDIEKLDEQLHRSLLWLLENNGVEELNMRFTIDVVVNERVRSVELLPGGRNKLVTDLNKEEYVSCLIDWRVHRETKAQLSALKSGFHEFIPEAKLKKFSEQEIEYLISGEAKIDTDDWEKNTIYKNCDREATIVTWFWQLITSGDEKFRYKVLQFVTGTQRIPTEGFQALQGSDGPRKFCIQRTADVHKLPSSHTWLDLPDYESFEELKMKLELAVSGFQGFSDEK